MSAICVLSSSSASRVSISEMHALLDEHLELLVHGDPAGLAPRVADRGVGEAGLLRAVGGELRGVGHLAVDVLQPRLGLVTLEGGVALLVLLVEDGLVEPLRVLARLLGRSPRPRTPTSTPRSPPPRPAPTRRSSRTSGPRRRRRPSRLCGTCVWSCAISPVFGARRARWVRGGQWGAGAVGAVLTRGGARVGVRRVRARRRGVAACGAGGCPSSRRVRPGRRRG